ncbi:MAG: ATPase, partial [Flavobacteriales bacterium CG_4_10_14_0_2_um_filter_32_8]
SFSLQNDATKKREFKGLISACEFLKVKKGIIVTYDEESIEKINEIEIKVIPAYKFMLEISSL